MTNAYSRRLLTKCDIDGLASALLLKEARIVDRIAVCHPADIQKGRIGIGAGDVTAGLPYHQDTYLAFDHLAGPLKGSTRDNYIVNTRASSNARVIFEHYGSDLFKSFPPDLLAIVDRECNADLSADEILYPTGWTLLTYLIDQRTGLERYTCFPTSTAELFLRLTEWCREFTIWEILDYPDVEERIDQYFAATDHYRAQILRCAEVYDNLVVVDFRKEELLFPGNRFMVYALFPECNVSLQVVRNGEGRSTTISCGRSFLDRSFTGDVGSLMRSFGGGGHQRAGACTVTTAEVDHVVSTLIGQLRYGPLKNLVMGYYV